MSKKSDLAQYGVEDLNEITASAPAPMRELNRIGTPVPLETLFPGDVNAKIRAALKNTGVAEYNPGGGNNPLKLAATLDSKGYVTAMAAKVSRAPSRSYDFVKDIKDFTDDTANRREDKIPVFYRIYRTEGLISNGINKSSSLVSGEGNFYVRRAKKGNRKVSNVLDELTAILDFWIRNVNARAAESAVTGARGLSSIIDQGSRQAFIEGSWVAYQHEAAVTIPSLGKKVKLPMFLQSMSSRYITIPKELVGTGLEQFYWEPPREVVNSIVGAKDEVKKLIDQSFSKDALAELKKSGKLLLDRNRVVHIKHRGIDTEPFGESFIEPIISSIAYKRSLQALDFVIIEALINRMLIVKVGDKNPDSDYHNLELAQIRLNLLKSLFDTTDPAITILWAGHDIEVEDVGAHDALADLDGRYAIADSRILNDMGIPETLLNGKNAGGQVWAAYEGYRETLRSMQNAWAQAMVSIGEQIATLNGFDGVELEFKFSRGVLADQSANADLALRKRQLGVASIRETIAATGGDFASERRNRLLEQGYDPDSDTVPTDEEIFMPPKGLPGQTTNQDGNVVQPGADPGRPPDSQRSPLAPERPPETKKIKP